MLLVDKNVFKMLFTTGGKNPLTHATENRLFPYIFYNIFYYLKNLYTSLRKWQMPQLKKKVMVLKEKVTKY